MLVGINAQKALERETGVGNYAFNLVRALTRLPEARGSLRLYLLHGREVLRPHLDGASLVGPEWNLAGSAARIAWEQLGLPRFARRDGVDVLHYVDHALPLLGRPCPVIITVHDLAFYRLPQMYNAGRRAYKRFVGLRSVERAAQVIVNSEATKAEVRALANISEEKISVIPYGLDAIFHPLPPEERERTRRKFDLHRPFFLFVGTMQPRKNLKTLIAAFARLVRANPLPHELVLAGGHGWLVGDLTAFAGEHRVADRVRFVGSIPHDELPGLYNCAESLVYPSWYEGFGLPPLEAMACETPVVAAAIPSITEVVGDAGLLVEPSDVTGLTYAMMRVASDQATRARMVESGLRRAQNFSWDQCARSTWAVYQKAAGECKQ